MQTTPFSEHELLTLDSRHVWHPYASIHSEVPVFAVERCEGAEIILKDGKRLVDGMASWWSVIHGYNHPELNNAVSQQMEKMAHVMFGGLTHQPAVQLAKHLVDITAAPLTRVFFSDSGSVAVEVALKMALQYWQARGLPQKKSFLSFRNGYHGDTFGAMSVCDPVTGMHSLFKGFLSEQFFAAAPPMGFQRPLEDSDLDDVRNLLEHYHHQIAALIIEPIVQGAGGMRFYSPEYLRGLRALCDHYEVLFIADEIATGLGRTGKLFACEHGDVNPDILCLGKTLTAGYITLAATLCSDTIAETICGGEASCFMHGPTYMANPLACAVACKSIELLAQSNWQANILRIEKKLHDGLAPCAQLECVANVRTLGAIGVVEMKQPVVMANIAQALVDAGIWLRPFGKLVYMMPPYIISDQQLDTLTTQTFNVLAAMER